VDFFNQLLVQNCLSWKLAANLSVAIYFQFISIFNHPRKYSCRNIPFSINFLFKRIL